MAVNTERFFNLLADYHRVLEAIRDQNQLPEDEVWSLLIEYRKDDDPSVEFIFKELVKARILRTITEQYDSVYEVDPAVQEVLKHVNQNYEILGIEPLKSHFKSLDKDRKELKKSFRTGENVEAKFRVEKMDKSLRELRKGVEENRKAIENEVDSITQSKGENRSLKEKYKIIENLWIEYVQPLGELVEPSGKPRDILSRVSENLQEGIEVFVGEPELSKQLEYTFQRLQNFLNIFQQSFDAVRREIEPLREQYRHSDRFLKGASIFIEAMQKDAVPPCQSAEWFKFPSSKREGLFSDEQFEIYLKKLSNFSPDYEVELTPPEKLGKDIYLSPYEIAREIEEVFEEGDVMEEILNSNPTLPVGSVLKAYGYCFRNLGAVEQDKKLKKYKKQGVTIHLYPIFKRERTG